MCVRANTIPKLRAEPRWDVDGKNTQPNLTNAVSIAFIIIILLPTCISHPKLASAFGHRPVNYLKGH